jgi:hypothetical protein
MKFKALAITAAAILLSATFAYADDLNTASVDNATNPSTNSSASSDNAGNPNDLASNTTQSGLSSGDSAFTPSDGGSADTATGDEDF